MIYLRKFEGRCIECHRRWWVVIGFFADPRELQVVRASAYNHAYRTGHKVLATTIVSQTYRFDERVPNAAP